LKTEVALKHYKTRRAMQEAAGVTKQAVARWFKTGLVPERCASRLNRESNEKLKIHPEHYTHGKSQE
jgi:hypothetical protein